MEEEIIIACCSDPSDNKLSESESSNKRCSLSAFRLSSKAENIISFKSSNCVPRGTTILTNPDGLYGTAGDYIAAVQGNKASIHFYTWSREQINLKCAAPEKIGPIIATKDGSYIVAGGDSGKAYIWEVCTGELIRVWKAHYRSISTLEILDDDSFLFSGGKDALVHSWSLADVLDEENDSLNPTTTWSDHRLPITSLNVTSGGANARIISCSLDGSIKIWNLPQKSLLCSIVFPCPLFDCAIDPAERWVYCGGEDGKVYMKAIMADSYTLELRERKRKRQNEKQNTKTSTDAQIEDPNTVLGSHDGSVLSLKLNSNGAILISGSKDGTCQIWDTQSRQSIKTLNFIGPVVDLIISTAPNKYLRGRGKDGKNISTLKPLLKYKSSHKQVTNKAEADGTGWVQVRLVDRTRDDKIDLKSKLLASFGQETSVTSRDGEDGIEKERLRNALSQLERDNDKWKTINSKLYGMLVEKFPES